MFQAMTQVLAFVYLFAHFKKKRVDLDRSADTSTAADGKRHAYEIYGDRFDGGCLIDVNYETATTRDLLKLLSVLFLSLAPKGTFSKLRDRCRELLDDRGRVLYVQTSLPSIIMEESGNGDLTVFSKPVVSRSGLEVSLLESDSSVLSTQFTSFGWLFE
jgi:hypothetical protein